MLCLFLVGLISKKAGNSDAVIGVIAGVFAILWMTFSYLIPEQYGYLRYPLHANMIIVVGTLVISLVGSGLARIRARSAAQSYLRFSAIFFLHRAISFRLSLV